MTKIQKITGWKPKTTFNKMIIDMVEHYKENIYEKR